jgi:ElaB/YqjD/DUF883 family membrane-anchored ribosome-binding protein
MSETSIGSAPLGQSSQQRHDVGQGADRGRLRDQIDERTTQAGREVRSFAEALRRSGSELRPESGGDGANRLAHGVADRLERFGGYLESARGDDLLRDGERFARERPWLVAGTAAVVGFAASRLIKASSEKRYGGQGNGGASLRGPSWPSADTVEMGRSGEFEPVEPAQVGSATAS